MRIRFLRVIIFAVFLVLAIELFYVQVIRGQYYYGQSVNNRIRVVPLDGQRGRILDRAGNILADNRLSFNVTVIPQDMQKSEELFDYLSGVLGVEKRKLLQRFYQKKIAPFAPVVIAEDVDKRIALTLEENKFRFPGLYIQESFRREYPAGDVGAHVLGYVGKISTSRIKELQDYGYSPTNVVGYSGVEEYYDNFLRGKEGGQQIEVDSRGRLVRLLGIREPQRGNDIQLSIDAQFQQAAVNALGDNHGAIIIMDLDTGDVLGMVSAPSYDPNVLVSNADKSQAQQLFLDPAAPMMNRAIEAQVPPGSVFKTVVSLAALATKTIEPATTFFCNGSYQLGRRRFRCAHVHGTQDLIEAIAHSCNVYFYNVGMLLGVDPLSKYAKLLGFGEKTYIDIPYEESGYVPDRVGKRKKYNEGWYKGDTLNLSIGQGYLLVTPIQAVRMMSTIARSGRVLEPHLISRIDEQNIVKISTVKNLHIRQEMFEPIQQGLRNVVTDSGGTARQLDMEGFKISGKTGTAQTVPGKKSHAWFVGYNQSENLRVAFCVYLEHGGSSYYAVRVARNMFKELKKNNAL